MARGIAARRGVEVAHGMATGHDPFAVPRRAAAAENVFVGVVEAHGAQQLGHRGGGKSLLSRYHTARSRSLRTARRPMPARRIAIVTGGNRGIGHEIARQLMKAELFVVIGARDAAKCEHALEELSRRGANVAAFPLDVNDTKSVRRFVEHVEKKHGAPGVLVNNAGVYPAAFRSGER